ncbi:uncharacterized protein ACIB01_014470 [Guaruba guarouba]
MALGGIPGTSQKRPRAKKRLVCVQSNADGCSAGPWSRSLGCLPACLPVPAEPRFLGWRGSRFKTKAPRICFGWLGTRRPLPLARCLLPSAGEPCPFIARTSAQPKVLSPWQHWRGGTEAASHLEVPPAPGPSDGNKHFPQCSPAQGRSPRELKWLLVLELWAPWPGGSSGSPLPSSFAIVCRCSRNTTQPLSSASLWRLPCAVIFPESLLQQLQLQMHTDVSAKSLSPSVRFLFCRRKPISWWSLGRCCPLGSPGLGH